VAVCFTGCSTLDKLAFWKKEEAPKTEPGVDAALSTENVKSSSVQELELKNAKLWTRVDELEEKVARQKERLKIIERGLMLGILPDELKGPGEDSATRMKKPNPGNAKVTGDESAVSALTEAISDANEETEKKSSPPADRKAEQIEKKEASGATEKPSVTSEGGIPASQNNLTPKEQEEYQRMLASAHDHYRSARYGKAVVEFSEIGKVFGSQVDGGMHRYWIAKSWIGLKEFQTARQQLSDFLRDFPASPWAPRAKLELARAEFQLGYKEKALQRLREVVQTHPYEDAAEMAKMELENLQKTL